MTSRVHGSSRGRVLPFSADDTAQNSMALRTRPWHFVPTFDVSMNTSYRQASQDHPCCARLHVSQDPSSSNAVFSEFWLSGCSSPCSWDHSRRSQPVVYLNRCSQPVVSLPAGPLTQISPLRPSTPTLNALPLSGNLLFSCIRASPSEPSVSSPNRQGFRTMAHSRWSTFGGSLLLAPTRVGYGGVSLVPLRALRLSPSTLWRPLVHVA